MLVTPLPGLVNLEDRFDRLLEEPRDTESKRQAGVVLPRFDRVYRLARYVEECRQFRLRPVTLCAKNSEPVLHGGLGDLHWLRRLLRRLLRPGLKRASKSTFNENG
jgi:hypothetical protein